MRNIFKFSFSIITSIFIIFFIISCSKNNYKLDKYITSKEIEYSNINLTINPSFDKDFSLVRFNYLNAYIIDNYNKKINIKQEYDKEKNKINISKHGLNYNTNYTLYLEYTYKKPYKFDYHFKTKDINYKKGNDYFLINNKDELLNIKKANISGKFLLKNNIDLNGEVLPQLFDKNKLVEFNGNNKKITNFKIDFINYKETVKVNYFLGDNAKFSDNTKENNIINKGELLKKPANPTKEGYEFVRWFSFDENQDFNFDEKILSSVNIYAKWKKLNTQNEEFYKPERVYEDSSVIYDINTFKGIFGDITDSKIINLTLENISSKNDEKNSFISKYDYSLLGNNSNQNTHIENILIKDFTLNNNALTGYKNNGQLDSTFSTISVNYKGILKNITIDNINVEINIKKDGSEQGSFSLNGLVNRLESNSKLENITIKNSTLKLNVEKNSVESTPNKLYKVSALSQESYINLKENYENINILNNNLSINNLDTKDVLEKNLFLNTNLDKKVYIYRQNKENKGYTKLNYQSIIKLSNLNEYYITYEGIENDKYTLNIKKNNNQDISFQEYTLGKDKTLKKINAYKIDENIDNSILLIFKLKGHDKLIFDPKKTYSDSSYDILTNKKEIDFGESVKLRLKTSTDSIYNTIYSVKISDRDSNYSSYYIYLTNEQIKNSNYVLDIPIYINNPYISVYKLIPQTYQITLLSPIQITGKNIQIKDNNITLQAGNLYKGIYNINVSKDTIIPNSLENVSYLNNKFNIDYNKVYNFNYNNLSIIIDNIITK